MRIETLVCQKHIKKKKIKKKTKMGKRVWGFLTLLNNPFMIFRMKRIYSSESTPQTRYFAGEHF
jgi:hypothetical protein